MKTKTDLYTKIVLTVIAIALVGNLLKDISFVSKAQANELDLSALKIENASDKEGTVYYIYDISLLDIPFGTEQYKKSELESHQVFIDSEIKKDPNEAFFDSDKNFPRYMITNKTGAFWIKK